MAIVEKLTTSIDRVVTIEFSDGEIVDARIVSVDPYEHEDVIYDVVHVRTPGTSQRSRRELLRASICEIVHVGNPID